MCSMLGGALGPSSARTFRPSKPLRPRSKRPWSMHRLAQPLRAGECALRAGRARTCAVGAGAASCTPAGAPPAVAFAVSLRTICSKSAAAWRAGSTDHDPEKGEERSRSTCCEGVRGGAQAALSEVRWVSSVQRPSRHALNSAAAPAIAPKSAASSCARAHRGTQTRDAQSGRTSEFGRARM
jgi:hypothetical protein